MLAGIPELVARLQQQQRQVFLVSGGFRPIINPIAEMLAIPLEHVYANTILYKVIGGQKSCGARLAVSAECGMRLSRILEAAVCTRMACSMMQMAAMRVSTMMSSHRGLAARQRP